MTPARTEATGSYALLLACFFLSGFAALLYEIVWQRQFSIAFGSSELAVSAVLAAYMAGLALGAWIAGDWLANTRRPVLAYAVLELGIGLAALAVPYGLQAVRAAHVALWGGQPSPPGSEHLGQTLFFFAGSLATVLIPTMMMGATLPLLSRYAVQTRAQIGSRVATLYATNTLGAVLGILTAAFVLVPALGLFRTALAGAAINVAVFALAAILARRDQTDMLSEEPAPASSKHVRQRTAKDDEPLPRAALLLPLMLVSGAASFTYEVLWVRLLGHVVGGSTYAFAVMLAAFLTGITLGSALAAPLARNARRAALGFALAQCGTAFLALVFYESLPWLADASRQLSGDLRYVGLGTLVAAGLSMLPTTLCIGATFPLAVRAVVREAAETPRGAGRVYAWNTVGCIAGALLSALVLIPLLGFEGTVWLAVGANIVVAAIATLLLPRDQRKLPMLAAVAVALVLLIAWPQQPTEVLLQSPFLKLGGDERVAHAATGRSASVVVVDEIGALLLRTNGMPEAVIQRRGMPPARRSEYLLTLLPVLARPDSTSMLVIGYGGGSLLERVPATIERIDAIELEEQVIEANRRVSDLRAIEPLDDPRVRITINDARGALALTTARYDIVVSQPSHPWNGGASHLFTREFFEIVRSHLNEGGVFCQWLNLDFLDERRLRMLTATLQDVFPHVRLHHFRSELFFVASGSPLEPERQLRDLPDGSPIRSTAAAAGFGTPEDVLTTLAVEPDNIAQLAGDFAPITDDRNALATMRAEVLSRSLGIEGFQRLVLRENADALVNRSPSATDSSLDLVKVSAFLAQTSIAERSEQFVEQIDDEATKLAALAARSGSRGEREIAETHLRALLALEPDNQRACFALVGKELTRLATGSASPQVTELAQRLKGVPAAVLEGFRLLHAGKFDEVLRLDEQLAASRPGEPWHRYAVHLRAIARLRGQSAAGSRVAAEEAVRILDSGLLHEQIVEMLVLRAQAGIAAGNADVVAGSAAALAQSMKDSAATQSSVLAARQMVALLNMTRADNPVTAEQINRSRDVLESLAHLGTR